MNGPIVIIHPHLSSGGGAEAVCAAAIGALARAGFQLRIITAEPSQRAQTALLQMDPGLQDVISSGLLHFQDTFVGRIASITPRRFKPPVLIMWALLLRELKLNSKLWSDASCVFSTMGEFSLSSSTKEVCYIHFPMLQAVPLDSRLLGGRLMGKAMLRRYYTLLCRMIASFDKLARSSLVFTNSHWTACHVTLAHPGCNPIVLYPPVRRLEIVGKLKTVISEDSTLCVMTLGRLLPYKGHDTIIRALQAACRALDWKGRLICVGRGSDEDIKLLRQMSTDEVTVSVVANAKSDQIAAAIAESHIGISAFAHEHFGMAIAEMQASGLPVLVPAGGGQVEIPPSEEFVYDGETDLCDTLKKIMREPEVLSEMSAAIQPLKDKFSQAEFDKALVSYIVFFLEQQYEEF